MKYHPVIYWLSTGLISAMMLFAAGAYLTHRPAVMAAFAHLGYPPYFANLLGIAKLLGVVALLWPRGRRIKEWAYAGFGITFIAAFVSHLVSGDGAKALFPVVAMFLLVVSYVTRPNPRPCSIKIPISEGELSGIPIDPAAERRVKA
jgi:peptidoglycan/LPS O-acetylase OafA/YrhL